MIESIHKFLHEWFGIPVLFSSIGKKNKNKCYVYKIFTTNYSNKIIGNKLLLVLIWIVHLIYFFTH